MRIRICIFVTLCTTAYGAAEKTLLEQLIDAAESGQQGTVECLVTKMNEADRAEQECLSDEILSCEDQIMRDVFSSLGYVDLRMRSPLHKVIIRGSLKAVNALLELGVCVDAPDANGCTPLHCAAVDRPVIVKRLLEKDATVNIVDRMGRTPLDYALSQLAGRPCPSNHMPKSLEQRALIMACAKILIAYGGGVVQDPLLRPLVEELQRDPQVIAMQAELQENTLLSDATVHRIMTA